MQTVFKIFFSSFLIFISLEIQAQKNTLIDSILTTKITKELKIKNINSIILLSKKSKNKELLESAAYPYIKWLFRNKNYKEIIDLDLGEFLHIFSEDQRQIILYYIARSFFKLNKYDESIAAFEKVISINKYNNPSAKAHSEIGRNYYEKNDFYNAIKYYEIAQTLLIQNENFQDLLSALINTAQTLTDLETLHSYKKGLHMLLKADSLVKKMDYVSDYQKYYINISLGEAYNQNEILNVDKGKSYFKKALAIAKKNKNPYQIAESYHFIGTLYNTVDPELGIKYQKKSILENKEKDSLLFFSNYFNMAFCYKTKKDTYNAITNCQKAIDHITAKKTTIKNISIETFYDNTNKSDLLILLNDLADIYLTNYKLTNKRLDLKSSIQTFKLADQLIDLIQIESQEFQSKLFWRKQSAELYSKAIEACYLDRDTEKAFYFMEKSKALLLSENLKNRRIKQSLNIPDSLINEEAAIKKNIYTLKNIVSYSSNKDSIVLILLDKERKLKQLQDSFQKNFKDYKALNLEVNILKLQELQNTLDDDTAVLTFNIGKYDDYGLITPNSGYKTIIKDYKYGIKTIHPAYGMLISKNKVDFFELKDSDLLKDKIQILLTHAKKPFDTKTDLNLYKKLAYKLFTQLMPTKKLQIKIKGKKLRIIPDSYLHYLPFEALFTSIKDNAEYWIEENEISYAFSNSFLANVTHPKINTTTTFAGFAPVNFETMSLTNIPNSFNELQSITKYFSGIKYTHKNATKKQFLEALPKYDIIHLATHANAQDSISPWIAFRNERLLQEELDITSNQAKMVVLSGCNTLLGKQETGEGVMSLARSFFQSGSRSVVSSLWNVDDESTADLMTNFYKNLSDGDSKSKALQNAKVNYLNTHNLEEASPYYWAPFVVLGDTTSLSNSFSWGHLWVLLLLIFITGYFFLKKNN